MKKTILISIAVSGLGVMAAFIFFFDGAKANTEDVRAICALKEGTDITLIIKKVRELNFSTEDIDGFGSGFEIFQDEEEKAISWSDDSLPGFHSGKVKVGKTSLPPFLKNYCELLIEARKLVSTRGWTQD